VNKGIVTDNRLLRQDDKIHDLVDVVEDTDMSIEKEDREIIVIDGRVYERVMKPSEKAHDIIDIIEGDAHDDAIRRISEIAERIAREVIPDIAERVIREEIDKLKR
jgi:hypothetical protein